jgi:hypothetical protein
MLTVIYRTQRLLCLSPLLIDARSRGVSGVLGRWWGLGLIVVPPVAFYFNSKVFYGSLALFGVLWVAIGYVLWSWRDTPSEQPSRVS